MKMKNRTLRENAEERAIGSLSIMILEASKQMKFNSAVFNNAAERLRSALHDMNTAIIEEIANKVTK